MPKYIFTMHYVKIVSAGEKIIKERQQTAVLVIISLRGGVQEKTSKKSHSTENESFTPLPVFILGTNLCPILTH